MAVTAYIGGWGIGDVNHNGVINIDDQLAVSSGFAAALPIGQLTRVDVDNIFGYAGYIFNPETGTYLARHRWYDPELGRWLSRDPAGYADGMLLYAYVNGNPMVLVDPLGLMAEILGAGKSPVGVFFESIWSNSGGALIDAYKGAQGVICDAVTGIQLSTGFTDLSIAATGSDLFAQAQDLVDADAALSASDIALTIAGEMTFAAEHGITEFWSDLAAGDVDAWGSVLRGPAEGLLGARMFTMFKTLDNLAPRKTIQNAPLSSSEGVVAAIGHNADVAVEMTRRAVARDRVRDTATSFGSRAHLNFRRLNDRLDARLQRSGSSFRVETEQFRDIYGDVVRRNETGSIGADALITHTQDLNFRQILDLKTHGSTPRSISAGRQLQFSQRFGTTAQEIYRQR